MNEKTAKKTRQLYRRDLAKTAKEFGAMIGNNLKPKPKLIPQRIWIWMMGFFIKINK